MIYDVIIVGAGASGLFAGINLDKKLNKLILEKTSKIGTKLLLSGGERANVSNINIDTQNDYFSQNKKFLPSVFSKYNQWNFIEFCKKNGIKLVEEDRGRLILETGNSSDILDLFLKKIKNNNCEIKLNSEVLKITPPNPLNEGELNNVYQVNLKNGKKILTKNIIISTGGKSFFQTGTTGDGYNFAKNFSLKVTNTFPGLCGITTKKDLSELSGISTNLGLKLIDKSTNKIIYRENGPLLFTHFGLSGPIIFNSGVAIGNYLEKISGDFNKYLINNLYFELDFELENLAKKIINFFKLDIENKKIILEIHSLRSLREAKVTTGGIDLNELDKNMQSKKQNGLFFIGEVVDVTGKTGGFNLQWCWSSAFICTDYINKIN